MRFFCMLLTLTLLIPVLPAQANINKQWNKERKLFEQALSKPSSKRLAAIKATIPRVGNYPLKPYLEYQLIKGELTTKSGNKVRSFQKRYSDSPISRNLQANWLNLLFKEGLWSSYLKEFDRMPMYGAQNQCMQQVARLKINTKASRKAALEAAEKLWLVGKSQPKACDPLFKAWRKAGRLTSGKATQRFWLAVEKGNYSLARYVTRYMSSRGDKAQAKRFSEIRKQPSRLFKSVRKNDDLRTLSYGLKRLLSKHPEKTVNYWLKVRKSRHLSAMQRAAIDKMLAQRLVTNSSDKKFALIAKLDPQHKVPEVTEAHLRLLLQQQRWSKISTLIDTLPEDKQQKDIWKYWKAVALKQAGAGKEAEQQANKLLLELAKLRRYYGYLAATLTNQPYELQADIPAKNSTISRKLTQMPTIQRAVELNKLGRYSQSSAEWRSAMAQLDDKEQKHAALLADKLGWHFVAITSAIKAGAWDLVEARFPRPHASTFKKLARIRKIDEHWAIAIARQESAFNARAKSRVGARGLMQLMPRTAKETARKHKVRYRSTNQLYNPSTNISLGTAYLSEMLKRFGGSRAYASAAYNAGPHRVKRWLAERGQLPLDIWIESIPFKETRNYVQNVLTYRVIYQLKSGQRGEFMEKNEIAKLSIKPVKSSQLLAMATSEFVADQSRSVIR